jgi:DNA-directed RNA polymerase subunit H (RpoH/RPB5)
MPPPNENFGKLFNKNMSRQDLVKKTILEMFTQRKYDDIQDHKNEEGLITAVKPSGEEIYAYSTIILKLNVEKMNFLISTLEEAGVKHGLLVYEGDPTPQVKKSVENMMDVGTTIELFNASDLQFNCTKHRLQPLSFTPLTKEEAVSFRERYGIQIPAILRTDPVARFYDFSRGEIVKIVRHNGFVTYKIVK